MQRTKAIRSFLIIPFLLLAGCQEEPKPEIKKPEPIAYLLVCKTDPDIAIAELEAKNAEGKKKFRAGNRLNVN